jgi:hypothetical protein
LIRFTVCKERTENNIQHKITILVVVATYNGIQKVMN